VLVHGPSYYSPAHRPSDPARFRVFLSSRAKRGRKQTPHRAPGEAARCRHVAHAPGSRCLRPCKPAGLCAVSSCRRSSRPRMPTRHPRQTPTAFQPAHRFAEIRFRGGPRGSAENVASAPARESASLDTRPITAVNTPPKRHRTSLPPHAGFLPQSRRTGSAVRKPTHHTKRPVPLPARNPMTNAPAYHPQTFRMQRFRLAESEALERLPALLSPTAARRRALAVILEDEHHREPEDLDVTAHCAGDKQTSGLLAAQQAVPRR